MFSEAREGASSEYSVQTPQRPGRSWGNVTERAPGQDGPENTQAVLCSQGDDTTEGATFLPPRISEAIELIPLFLGWAGFFWVLGFFSVDLCRSMHLIDLTY